MANLRSLLGGLSVVVPLSLAPSAAAQQPAPAEAAPRPDLSRSLEAWRRGHGSAWRVHADPATGFAEMLYGGSAAPARVPANDADFQALALESVAATRALHGVDPAELEAGEVAFLPLGQIGSTDKIAVELVQRVGGIAVRRGTVHALFDTDGRLLAVHAQGLPRAGEIDLEPALPAADAVRAAAQAFWRDEQALASWLTLPELELVRAPLGSAHGGVLAWRVEARFEAPETMPAGRVYWIDADAGTVLDSERTVHEFEVRGTVRALVSPGLAPDTASNPEAWAPMRYLKVTSSQGTVYTDANGNFSYPNFNSSLSVTVNFQGTFNNVQNVAGAEYSLTQTLPANQDNTLSMNPSGTAQVTAQSNAFHHVNLLRDWIRSIVPTDAHADAVSFANVNLNQTCNAYFDGSSTNYFLAGGSCPNTSYSTVVAHENGHWLNVRYGTGNGMDGMGEGNADIFSMYQYDSPIVGQDFCGTGCHVRTGLNTRQFCGDLAPSCYGQVHADGEPWMGAAWKVRVRLNTALGNAAGDLAANTLFLSWMNAFNQSTIRSIIETQWLLLDDDDGNLNNGSPNYAAIDAGFREQGFPGVDLHPVTIDQVTVVPDSTVEIGPYGVEARAVAHMPGRTIASQSLFWRVNGGAWNQIALVDQGNGLAGHSIPPVPTPAQIDYYVSAIDSLGDSAAWPEGAPASVQGVRIGEPVAFYQESFETGAAGWTHASYGDTPNTGDDWEVGPSGGISGSAYSGGTLLAWRDPSSAASGVNCWGTDLGVGTNGAYAFNMHTWLRSPPIDCSGHTGVHLRFQRWLSVQAGQFDQARVRVNGSVVWENPASIHILDQAWSQHELDISAVADGNPAVTIEFEIRTDATVQLGGWSIDDVQLLRLGPAVSGCVPPTVYGPGKVNSNHTTAVLAGNGDASLLFNTFRIGLTGGPAFRHSVVYSSAAPAFTPLLGGTLLLAQPYAREIAWQLDAFGQAEVPYAVLPSMVGTTRFFQAVFRDPGAADGTGLGFSKALRVGFCP